MTSEWKPKNPMLVAKNAQGDVRAMCRMDTDGDYWSCKELAEILLDWHEADPNRHVEILLPQPPKPQEDAG